MEQGKDSVLMRMYDFVKDLVPLVNKLPRDQRFILGTRIETKGLEILDLLVEAYYLPKERKRAVLTEVNIRLEQLRFLLRMGLQPRLKYYHSGLAPLAASCLCISIEEIGKRAELIEHVLFKNIPEVLRWKK